MSETPQAGWYDDPEDPSQYRYWDGTAWSFHRSPKPTASATTTPAQPVVPYSAGDTVSRSFRMVFDDFGPVFGLAALAFISFVVAVILFGVGFSVQVEEGLDAFEDERTEFVVNAGGIVLWVVAALLYIGTAAIAFPTAQVRYETTRRGRSAPIGNCVGYAATNIWRTLGRFLLVLLAYATLVVSAVALLYAASVIGLGWVLGLVVVLPVAIAAGPVITLAMAGIAVAPPGVGPIRFALAAARRDWALLAGAVYQSILVLLVLGVVGAFAGLLPVIGWIIAIGLSFFQTAVPIAVGQFQWIRAEGEVDPAIIAMTESSWRS
ncbi:MAG: DUF2510 domain-containing protein [Actinomycetota bacterium]